jgi:iron(III) transport system permease protein
VNVVRPVAVVAWSTTGLLVLVPLLALAWAAAFPAPDPFAVEPPSLVAMLRQPRFVALLARSLGLSLAVAALVVPVGTWLAWAEHRLAYPGRTVLAIGTLLPLAIPSYVLAAAVARLVPSTGLLVAAGVIAIVTVPYVQLVVGTALVNGSAAEEEAARALGAGPWRVFVDVVAPRIRPALGYATLLAMLYALSDFGAVAVLDAPVLTWRLYQAVAGQELGRAALLGAALLASTLPLFIASQRLSGSGEDSTVANPRPPARRTATGLERVLVYGVAGVVIGVGVVLPVASLVGWTVVGLQQGAAFAPLGEPVLHTILAAALGTMLTVLLALAPAVAVGWRRRTGALDRMTYLTSALPGVLLAFGWILGALALARMLPFRGLYAGLLSSGTLLFIGYATRYLAEAYTPLKALVWRFDRRLLHAHRALGAPAGAFVVGVAWPHLRPGVAAAALLVFLAVLKELPVTLLLGNATGLTTLAFRVWDRHAEALWHDAGAAGLCLVGLALAGVGLSLRWRRNG